MSQWTKDRKHDMRSCVIIKKTVLADLKSVQLLLFTLYSISVVVKNHLFIHYDIKQCNIHSSSCFTTK